MRFRCHDLSTFSIVCFSAAGLGQREAKVVEELWELVPLGVGVLGTFIRVPDSVSVGRRCQVQGKDLA